VVKIPSLLVKMVIREDGHTPALMELVPLRGLEIRALQRPLEVSIFNMANLILRFFLISGHTGIGECM